MKYITSVVLSLSFVAVSFATSQVEERTQRWEEFKARKLAKLERKEKKLQGIKQCLQQANDYKSFKECRERLK
ncbi:MAG: hypothetical protein ABDH29_04375 [Aquificaceae bacterium]